MRITTTAFLCACLAPTAVAQGWSLTANAPFQGTATTTLTPIVGPPFTQSSILPVGPVTPGMFFLCSVSSPLTGTWVSTSWDPNPPQHQGPLAFSATETFMFISQGGAYAANPTATLDAVLDLTLHAPQPTSGRLHVRRGDSFAPGSIALDLGADGGIDFLANGPAFGTYELDLPLRIPAGGQVIRLHYQLNLPSLGLQSPPLTLSIAADFYPGEIILGTYDTTGMGTFLSAWQTPGSVSLQLGNPNQTPLLLAFGAQPTNIPLLPTVTQLVSLDAIYATGAMSLPLPQLPSGTTIFCQGLSLDASNTLLSSNSIRALWP
jgi:hypothetical protein